MFKKYFAVILFLVYFTVGCASANEVPVHNNILPVDIAEANKALIIGETLNDIDKKDHFVTEDGRIFLSVAESLFNLLPKEINGIKLELLKGTPPDGELKVAYLTFSRWSSEDGTIFVTSIAHFYGGNKGGCRYKFVLVGDSWKEQKRDCFAAAS